MENYLKRIGFDSICNTIYSTLWREPEGYHDGNGNYWWGCNWLMNCITLFQMYRAFSHVRRYEITMLFQIYKREFMRIITCIVKYIWTNVMISAINCIHFFAIILYILQDKTKSNLPIRVKLTYWPWAKWLSTSNLNTVRFSTSSLWRSSVNEKTIWYVS